MLEVGQVLSLVMRFNNVGLVSDTKHPYLIIAVEDTFIEVAQFDSINPRKRFKAAFRSNKIVKCTNPVETVLDKDSFIQMDNKILIENYEDITKYRRSEDKLSAEKLRMVIKAYRNYQDSYPLDENKIVYISKEELEKLNL